MGEELVQVSTWVDYVEALDLDERRVGSRYAHLVAFNTRSMRASVLRLALTP